MTSLTDGYLLSNGVKIPCVGFGTWQTPDGEVAVNAVKTALRLGYRHIDTAAGYGNEASVGRAVRESGLKRENVFLTSKLNNPDHGYDATHRAFERTMKNLGTDYLDLYLIHWPNPVKFRSSWKEANAGTWKAFEELYREKRIRAIGVSNFRPRHFAALMETAEIQPMVNQIRLCPGDIRTETVDYCRERGILLEAYSPLGTGQVFEVPELKTMAEKYKKSVAQVCLRWSLQMGFLPLPKSVTQLRIQENAELFDFELSEEDVRTIAGLAGCCGASADPDQTKF